MEKPEPWSAEKGDERKGKGLRLICAFDKIKRENVVFNYLFFKPVSCGIVKSKKAKKKTENSSWKQTFGSVELTQKVDWLVLRYRSRQFW